MKIEFLPELEIFFTALADKTRLRILNLMREDEICVCFFTEVLGESQPKISRHLAYLRNAGLVEARRDGKWMNYRLIRPQNEYARQVLGDTLNWLDSDAKMREDYEKLAAVCCSENLPAAVARAPKPNTFVQANIKHSQSEPLETFLL